MDLKIVAKRLRELLENTIPGRLDKALLFGSRARGEAAEDADLDILVVVHGSCPWKLQHQILDACYTIALEFDVVTDIKVYGSEELSGARGRQPFILNALNFGIAA